MSQRVEVQLGDYDVYILLLLLASEAATLKYIKANNTIPIPEVLAYRQAQTVLILDDANNHTAIPETMI